MIRASNFDRILTSTPINRQAQTITSGGSFEPPSLEEQRADILRARAQINHRRHQANNPTAKKDWGIKLNEIDAELASVNQAIKARNKNQRIISDFYMDVAKEKLSPELHDEIWQEAFKRRCIAMNTSFAQAIADKLT